VNVVVTGGTGFIGVPLVKHRSSLGDEVTVLTRDPEHAKEKFGDRVRCIASLADAGEPDLVINLAGEPMFGKRWTKRQKQVCTDSRIKTTHALVELMKAAKKKPRVFLSASAIGFYGDCKDEDVDEAHPVGSDFTAKLCEEWEAEALLAKGLGVRVVLLRIGLVLARGGGMIGKMEGPFRKGLGGAVGSGDQWMSWIHMDDMLGIIDHAIASESVQGPVNATAPDPATNLDFSKVLCGVVGSKLFWKTPPFVMKLVFGEAAEMALTGQRVFPKAAEKSGYVFRHPKLEETLRSILG
jgi:uncharacterized protein (TIGR01777 family)